MRRALSCFLATSLIAIGACANTRLKPPEKRTDCDDAPDSEACSDQGSEPGPSIDPIVPFELTCDEDGTLEGTAPFEILASGDDFRSLAIAPDGTVFAAGTIDNVPLRAFRLVDGEMQPFGEKLWDVGQLIVDGSELIATAFGAIVTVDLRNQDQRLVWRNTGFVSSVAADRDAIYWIRHVDPFEEDGTERYQVWRGPRGAGENALLAEIDDGAYGALVTLHGELYFLSGYDALDDGEALQRIAKDGSSGANTVLQVQGYVDSIRTDGEDLYFTVFEDPEAVDPGEHRIVRVDSETFEAETVFDIAESAELVMAHDRHLYWTVYAGDKVELWRGPTDGFGEPEHLGTSEASIDSLTRHDGELYWVASCWLEDEIATKSSILKMSD